MRGCCVWLAVLLGAMSGVPWASAAQRARSAAREPAMTASLRVSPQRVIQGQSVTMRLTLSNCGQRDSALPFRSGQRYDFVVTRDGREVWRWSAKRFFTMALGQVRLRPGEARSFVETWNLLDGDGNPVAEGTYTIVGVITARPEIRTPPARVRVVAAP